jgi:hypothetical protein
MTKEKLERAKILERKIQVLQEEIESIKEIANPTKECRLTNFEYNITIFLTTQEKAIVLPALLERKTEELKLLQEEFERL